MRPLAGTEQHGDAVRPADVGPRAATVREGRHAGDLGVWITPKNPTLGQLPGDVWNLQKSVVDLAAPATYRFRVTFRWTGAGGHVLGTTVRYSHRLPAARAAPRPAVVRRSPCRRVANHAGEDLYTRDDLATPGNTAAGPFEVLFAPGGGIGAEDAARSRS